MREGKKNIQKVGKEEGKEERSTFSKKDTIGKGKVIF